jgi:hypothetical protein
MSVELIDKGLLKYCRNIARKQTRMWGGDFDEAESEAYLALGVAYDRWLKVSKFTPDHPEYKYRFDRFARSVVYRFILKFINNPVKGYRTRDSRRGVTKRILNEEAPRTVQNDDEYGVLDTSDNSGPVGWEAEYEDTIRNYGSKMPKRVKDIFIKSYLDARFESPKEAVKHSGLSSTTIQDYRSQAYKILKEYYGVG